MADAAPACDNPALTAFDGLLVLAPHPDDEMLGFAGLVDAYRRQGKPVRVVVVTDGDAYCEACTLWKNSAQEGQTCNALELSNFATPEIDSFAEVRRSESTAAAALLGLPAPQFLGYPDTGLATAWGRRQGGGDDIALHRSDFSGCNGCQDCAGYGAGPELELTNQGLEADLAALMAQTSPGTLVATTHWLDGHGDHAALGEFTRTLAAASQTARAQAYSVIHAHTPGEFSHPDCWYPQPAPAECLCGEPQRAMAEPRWWEAQQAVRVQPELAAELPDDADYGAGLQLCLAPELYSGPAPVKQAIVAEYASQLGSLGRDQPLPAALDGILDCNGYLKSFARSSEAFVLLPAGGH
jgi:LmbE family N-acetylglucosaminyl deacetylase